MSPSKVTFSHLELSLATRKKGLMKAGAILVHSTVKGFLKMSLQSPKFSDLSYYRVLFESTLL